MKLNEIIKLKRQELGFSCNEVATKSGLSISEYADIEDYPDEIATVLQLSSLRQLCRVLKIDIHDLLKNMKSYTRNILINEEVILPVNDLIKNRREAANLTRDELGEKLGFYEQAIIDMESNPEFFEGWPLELIIQLCRELGIPVSEIIDKSKSTISE